MALKRPFPELDWHLTPETVRHYILYLEQTLHEMQQRVESHEQRIEKLETQTHKNSRNSSKPPSSDPPFARKKRKQKKSNRAKGGQKGHEPHQQQVLDPTETQWLVPERCTCGHSVFDHQQMQPFYLHQHIELPIIEMEISHFILQQCDCPNCGKTVKAKLPSEVATGYGPRFSAFIGELSGIKAMSRNDVKQLCESVLQVPIATGTIQKIVDRTSEALFPVYAQIGQIARSFWCNYIDETSWFRENDLHWLWAMVNERVAFYRIDPHRSKAAFEMLVQEWEGILVSDGYGLYLLEANAAGVPVVQPATGAFPEIIEKTMGGVTYSPDTVADLAASLLKLFKDNDLRLRLGENGKEIVIKELTLEKMSDGLSEVYNSII